MPNRLQKSAEDAANQPLSAEQSTPGRRERLIAIALWGGAILTLFVLWGTGMALGVENVWTWPRRDLGVIRFDRVAVFLLLAALWAITARVVETKFEGTSKKVLPVALLLSFLFSVALPLAAIASIDDISGLSRAPFFHYYERTSGHYWQARYEAEDLGEYLRTYDDRLRRPAANHLISHPPGLVVLNAILIRACSSEPLQRFAAITTPENQRVALDFIQSNAHRTGRRFDEVDRCSLWIATLAMTLIMGLTSPLILLIGGMFVSRQAAWIGAALWPFIPAVAVMFPSYYIAFAPFALLILGVWTLAIRRQSLIAALLCGVLVTLGLGVSLLTAAMGFLAGLSNILRMRLDGKSWSNMARAHLRPLALLVAVLVAGWLSFRMLAGLDLIEIFRINMVNGRRFIVGTNRQLLPWLWLDPLITAFGFGLPVTVAWASTLFRRDSNVGARALTWSMAATFLILALLGLSRGEAIRHMIFIIPWLLIPLGAMIARLKSRRLLLHLMTAQIVTWAAIVLTIDGFHFHS